MGSNRNRVLRAVATAVAAVATLAAAPAQAKIIEMGKSAQEPTPSCPGKPCLAISRTTGYQAKAGSERGLFTVPEDGKVVAWTVSLGTPTDKQIEFFDENYGGAASAGITVVRPGRKLYGRITGQSPVMALRSYFGETVQFPLGRSLNVKKGYVVGLTVPTWAPALAVGFGNDHSWRASRLRADGGCTKFADQTAQTALGALTRFECLYRTARLTYTVTLITNPRPSND